jgi:magnesium chelatase subunit I
MGGPPDIRDLRTLRQSGWATKTVKQEVQENFLRKLASGEELFPGILGYDATVIPEINLALIAGHDMLFLGRKGRRRLG